MNRPDASSAYAAAVGHYQHQRIAEAESALRAAVAADPRHADALHLLAVISYQRGNAHGAIPLVQRATTICPTSAAAWNTLGECYRTIGQLATAINCYHKAVALDATFAGAYSNLAVALNDAGQPEPAAAAARAALAADPRMVNAHSALGQALRAQGDLAGGLAALAEAVAIAPDDAAVQNNLGVALEAVDRLDEALDAYRRAAELAPHLAVVCNNYLNVARQLCRWDEAVAWTDRALRSTPDYGPALWNQGLLQLTMGDYARGLPNYERRFTATAQRHPPALTGRPWDGRESMAGRTLLLYAEQGFGDGFQAARYVPIIARRVGRVVILCHREQARLFERLPGASAVATDVAALPAYDRFAGLMSLPYLCGTASPAAVPAAVPYLSPPPDCTDRWRARLARFDGGGPKVGLTWHISRARDERRSCPLADLAPLLDVPGVQWFGLQVGPAAAQLADVRGVVDLSPELADFAETAAAVDQLDLVVTVDTAVAHVAGARGRPTWVLVPFSPDWRWMLDRKDSPWYPTVRLFRQPRRNAWGPVVERMTDELRAWAAAIGGR